MRNLLTITLIAVLGSFFAGCNAEIEIPILGGGDGGDVEPFGAGYDDPEWLATQREFWPEEFIPYSDESYCFNELNRLADVPFTTEFRFGFCRRIFDFPPIVSPNPDPEVDHFTDPQIVNVDIEKTRFDLGNYTHIPSHDGSLVGKWMLIGDVDYNYNEQNNAIEQFRETCDIQYTDQSQQFYDICIVDQRWQLPANGVTSGEITRGTIDFDRFDTVAEYNAVINENGHLIVTEITTIQRDDGLEVFEETFSYVRIGEIDLTIGTVQIDETDTNGDTTAGIQHNADSLTEFAGRVTLKGSGNTLVSFQLDWDTKTDPQGLLYYPNDKPILPFINYTQTLPEASTTDRPYFLREANYLETSATSMQFNATLSREFFYDNDESIYLIKARVSL